MRFPGRRPPVAVAPGERLLAWAERSDGGAAVGGTRDAVYLPQRVAWQDVATAEWDKEQLVLRVVELAPYGEAQPVHEIPLHAPDRLLQLVRERITATFVIQQYVEVARGRGARIFGRRPPAGGPVHWFVEYDAGLDPADPAVASAIDAAVAAAKAEVGE